MTLETPAAARTLSRGLAPIVEALELQQEHLVTTATLEGLARQAGLSTPARVLAARLRKSGWLLPTARRGVYEFAPGSHAGALSRGDVTLPLQAALHGIAEPVAGLTLQSAAWALGAADRAPSRLEVAAADAKTQRRLHRVLGDRARVVPFAPNLPWERHRGVPVLSADSVLVHAATRPNDVRSWDSALDWLTELAADATFVRLADELTGRPRSVTVRLAYLLSGLRPDVTEALDLMPGSPLGRKPPGSTQPKVYFGPRGRLLRHDARRQVADTTLPFDPRKLPQVRS